MSDKEKIAVTGASGFIGKNLIQSLGKGSYEVRVVKRDLISGEGLKEFLNGSDILIHLASLLTGPEGEVYKFNTTSVKNLLNLAKGITKIIFVSSAAVYGKTKGIPFKEENVLSPDNEYARSKADCESEIIKWSEDNGIQYIILRPFNVYGPGSDHGVVASMMKSIKEKGKITVNGDPEKILRDFLYVQDFVDVLILVLKSGFQGIYNIGWGKNRSLAELITLLKKFSKKSFELEIEPNDPTKSGNIEIDTTKASTELLWRPKVNLEEGIKKTVEWFGEQK
ncbi:MAG: NAD(P)-dependent oxidoreductase [Patescibacteria group bacterium]